MPKTFNQPRDDRSIIIENVHKSFMLRHTHSLKETLVAAVRRRKLTTKFRALDGVDFAISEGESVALLGFNGSGKSTTLKMISGVLRPDSGRVLTRGRVAGLIEVGAGFHPDLSGRENVYLNAAILGMTKQETDERFDEIVAFSEIEQFIDTEVKHYSSGMFLRLAFAVAIHTELDVLLIDEILAVGDEPFQRKCLARIRDLHAQGKTLVVVSHDLNMVSRLCARGIVLSDGKVVFDGPSHEAVRRLRDLSTSPFVDVERSHPYFQQIAEISELSILPPYPHDTGRVEFRPLANVGLGECALALRAVFRSGDPSDSRADQVTEVSRAAREQESLEWLGAALGARRMSPSPEPARVTTRAEFAQYLFALAGSPVTQGVLPFADVSADDDYAEAAAWMHLTGIARGWEEPDGLPSFGGGEALTREALVIMLARFGAIGDKA